MKKLLALILVAALAVSFAACASNDGDNADVNTSANPEETMDAAIVPETTEAAEENNDNQAVSDGAAALLNTVWASYGDDDKFPVAGGDMENANMEGAGDYALTDATALDTALGFPAASVDKIDEAASLVHMMNANTFTCGAYHVVNAEDMADLQAAIKDNIMQRQWLCGFPDKLVIVTVDNYVIAFFGENEIVDTFAGQLASAFATAQTVCDEPIA